MQTFNSSTKGRQALEDSASQPLNPSTTQPSSASHRELVSRAWQVDRLKTERFDLFVIGGGITGAGIALDAALRGLRVGLVDKGDFAAGTSCASSKLIHGGLRYLEHGEFGLVREALRERHILLRIAPHLVRPLRILLPGYAGAGRPRWKVKIGLSLYDWLAGGERIGRHRKLDAREMVEAAPGLRAHGLKGGFEFFDAQMDDARLCLEVVLTAIVAGARAANYVEVVAMHRDRAGQVCRCEVRDHLTSEIFAISSRRFVNASGPWLDEISAIDESAAPARLALTRGVHIVLPRLDLAAGLLVTHPDDARVLFILPWMNRTLVGTTDTVFEDRPDRVSACTADVDYLLAATNHYFPQRFTHADVVATLAGLRPLLQGEAKDPSELSREFAIFRSKSGLWSIAGGKFTTYRSMAEEIVDRIVHDLGVSRRDAPCKTREHKLIGTPATDWHTFCAEEPKRLAERRGISPGSAEHLIDRYGQRALLVEGEFAHDPSLWSPLCSGEPDLQVELAYQAAYEMAVRPADHLLRRTRLGLFHPELLAKRDPIQ